MDRPNVIKLISFGGSSLWTWLPLAAILAVITHSAFAQDDSSPSAKQQSEKPMTNSVGMKLQLIPAGEFTMGNDESVDTLLKTFPYANKDSISDAERRHRVKITKPYYFGTFAVTRGQFAQFVKAENYKTEAEKDGRGGYGPNAKGEFEQKPEYTWRNPGFTQTDDHPVVNVSWNDAQAFIAWLSKAEGKKYRLPTEAEWEYACRAGSTTRYYFGNDPEELAKFANVADGTAKAEFSSWTTIAAKDGYVHTAPVGKFKPNAFGLYDMHGNVWHWCSDWYDADYYANSPASDPQGPTSGSFRVDRGGSWSDAAAICRSANRGLDGATYRSSSLGFRVVLAPSN